MAEQVLTIFFIACSAVSWLNVNALLRDRKVSGVSTIPTFIFTATNLYEVWYFGHLHQLFATFGAVTMALINITWLSLVHFYRFEQWVEDQLDLVG